MATEKKVNIVVSVKDQFSKKMGNMSDSMSSFGKTALDVTAKATKALAALSTVAGGFAVKEFATFEKSMSEVKAITNATSDEFAKLTELAKEQGRTTVFSATQSAEAMKFLGMAGFTTEEVMSSLGATMELAAAANIDLGRAADIASNILSQFKIDASEAGRVVDILAATVTSSNTNMEQLSEAMKFFGPTAAAFGISIEEAAATVGILGNFGLQGSIATRALGTALTRLARPTSAMQKVMDDMGFAAFDTAGKFKGMAGIVRELEEATAGMTDQQKQGTIALLFGGEAIQEMNSLLTVGADAIEEYTRTLELSEGAARRMAKTQLDNLAGSFTLLKSATSGLGIEIGSIFAPSIRGRIDFMTSSINDITEALPAFKEQLDNIKNSISGAIGDDASNMINKAREGFKSFIDDMVSIVTFFTDSWGTDWQDIQDTFAKVWDFFINDVYPNVIKPLFDTILSLIKTFTFAFMLFFDGLRTFWQGFWGRVIQSIFVGGWEVFKALLNTALAVLRGDWGEAWEHISNMFITVWEGIQLVFTAVWDSIKDSFSTGVDWIETQIDKLMDKLAALGAAIKKYTGVGIIESIGEKASELGASTREVFRANGGTISAGQPTVVGERGRELFVPNIGGRVIPNGDIGGKTVNFAPVFNIEGGDSEDVADAIMEKLRSNSLSFM